MNSQNDGCPPNFVFVRVICLCRVPTHSSSIRFIQMPIRLPTSFHIWDCRCRVLLCDWYDWLAISCVNSEFDIFHQTATTNDWENTRSKIPGNIILIILKCSTDTSIVLTKNCIDPKYLFKPQSVAICVKCQKIQKYLFTIATCSPSRLSIVYKREWLSPEKLRFGSTS